MSCMPGRAGAGTARPGIRSKRCTPIADSRMMRETGGGTHASIDRKDPHQGPEGGRGGVSLRADPVLRVSENGADRGRGGHGAKGRTVKKGRQARLLLQISLRRV